MRPLVAKYAGTDHCRLRGCSGLPLARLDHFLAAHVRTHGLRDLDRTVGLLVVLENRHKPAGGGQGAVERGDRGGAAVGNALANVESACWYCVQFEVDVSSR